MRAVGATMVCARVVACVLLLAIPVMAEGTREPRNLTANSRGPDQNPVFTLDGSRIVFTSERARSGMGMWSMDLSGERVRPLVLVKGHDVVHLPGSSVCKKDGRIVFSSDAGGNDAIWTARADGTDRRELTRGQAHDREPTWSPTCDRIVFESDRSGNYDLWVMRDDGSGLRQITQDPASDTQPNWSPVADTILFQSQRDGQWSLYTVDASGRNEIRVSRGTSEDTDGSFSPDGQRIVYSTDAGAPAGTRIAILDLAKKGPPRFITRGPSYDGAPVFSPDGSRIAFESDRAGNLDIWIVDAP